MDLPPLYWASTEKTATLDGRDLRLRRWGWSRHSHAEAQALAARRVDELIARGGPPRLGRSGGPDHRLRLDDYYPASPQREEVLDEVFDDEAGLIATLTRNRYGAAILNTDAVLIADIDVGEETSRRRGNGGFLSLLRRRRSEETPEQSDAAAAAQEAVTSFASANPGLGVRTYRTRGGFRVFITGTGAQPGGDEAEAVLDALGTDALYSRLCRTARTCRARLTPKPWRIGYGRLPVRWPAEAPRDREAYTTWVRGYETASADYAVCRLVTEASSPGLADLELPAEASHAPALSAGESTVIRLHDAHCRVGSDAPLA